MKKYDVVAIGNALFDILLKSNDEDLNKLELTKGNMHLVDSDRQQQLLTYFESHKKQEELGGSALNSIRTLAALGAKTVFAGMIGKDEYGKKTQKRLEDIGIAPKIQTSDNPTGTCIVLISPDGERTMNTSLGASRLFDESLVPFDEIADAKIFHFCGYQWDTEGQKKAIRKAIEHAKKNNTLVSFDVADPFVVGRFGDEFKSMIKENADIVFANEEEAKLLFNSTPEEAAIEISEGGAIAVIKLGKKGALVMKGEERIEISPIPTTVVDTTAAGDMFAAGFLYGMYRNQSLEKCGKTAALLASDVISRFGAVVSDEVLDKAALV